RAAARWHDGTAWRKLVISRDVMWSLPSGGARWSCTAAETSPWAAAFRAPCRAHCRGNVASAAHTALEAAVHTARIPTCGKRPHDFRSLQADLRQDYPRQPPPALAIGQREYAAIECRALEARRPAFLEGLVDISRTQAQPRRDREQQPLRAARSVGIRIIGDQRTVGRQRLAGEDAHRPLKRGVAAGVLARVVVGESIEVSVVRCLVIEQMCDAEVDAGAAGEELVAQVAPGVVIRVGLDRLELLGEGDADLHGPAGADRIPACEQPAAQRYTAGE